MKSVDHPFFGRADLADRGNATDNNLDSHLEESNTLVAEGKIRTTIKGLAGRLSDSNAINFADISFKGHKRPQTISQAAKTKEVQSRVINILDEEVKVVLEKAFPDSDWLKIFAEELLRIEEPKILARRAQIKADIQEQRALYEKPMDSEIASRILAALAKPGIPKKTPKTYSDAL